MLLLLVDPLGRTPLVPNYFLIDLASTKFCFGCQTLRKYTANDLRNYNDWCWDPDSASNLATSGTLEAALRAYDPEFFNTVEGEMCCLAHDGFFCNTFLFFWRYMFVFGSQE